MRRSYVMGIYHCPRGEWRQSAVATNTGISKTRRLRTVMFLWQSVRESQRCVRTIRKQRLSQSAQRRQLPYVRTYVTSSNLPCLADTVLFPYLACCAPCNHVKWCCPTRNARPLRVPSRDKFFSAFSECGF